MLKDNVRSKPNSQTMYITKIFDYKDINKYENNKKDMSGW